MAFNHSQYNNQQNTFNLFYAKKITKLFSCVLFIQVISFTSIAFADDYFYNLPPRSSINIGGSTDSSNNKNSQIQLNLELKNYQQIAFGYGRFSSDTASLNMTQRFISAGTNPYKKFSINTSYTLWGKSNSLETQNFKSDLNLNLSDWSLSFSPQLNVVTIYGVNNIQKFDLYAKSATFLMSYFGIEDYFFIFSYYKNDFADDSFFLTNTTLIELSARVSETAQILISGLEKNNVSISVGRFFNKGSISLDLARSSTSFSDITTHFLSVYADFTINKNIDLYFGTSIQNSNYKNSTLTAIDFGISYNW